MSFLTPPIKLSIPGEFWDSQLYAGELQLFGQQGELTSISWDQLVHELPLPEELRVAANAALLGNHSLYEPGARELIADPEIRPLLIDKFQRLSNLLANWQAAGISLGSTQDNRLPFPHNDSEIHYNRLYVGASQGLYGLATGAAKKSGREVVRYSDAPALDIAAKFSTIAQASGSDGLFEVSLAGEHPLDAKSSVNHLSQIPCSSCEWAFSSVVATGQESTAYVASFERVKPDRDDSSSRRRVRKFDRVIAGSEMFSTPGTSNAFTWGARDKMFRYIDNRVEIVRYSPAGTKSAEALFSSIGDIELTSQQSSSSVVSARVAPFGSVIEQDNGLLVVPSEGDSIWLPGEPVNWRVFPRSIDYLNHLHVVYEDRLEVWAFTHDYFADQQKKLFGTTVASSADQ